MKLRFRKPKFKPVELYENISEMILHNWEQLQITGDSEWLIKKEKEKKYKGTIKPERLKEVFFSLHDQYAKLSNGVSEVLEKWHILVLQQMDAMELVAKGDRSQMNFVNMYQKMIDNLMNGGEDVDIIKSRMMYQKEYGQPIRPKEITVPEYRKIVELIDEENARNSSKNIE